MPYVFITAKPKDASYVIQMAKPQLATLFPTTPDQTELIPYLQSAVEEGRARLIVNDQRRDIAGFVLLKDIRVKKKNSHKGLIELVVIRPAYQKKGLGTACIAYALRTFETMGYALVEVNALDNNPAALHIYKDKFGFEQVDKKELDSGVHFITFHKKIPSKK